MKGFKELSKGDKIFRIINICLSVMMSVLCVVLSFYYGLVNNWNNRLGSAIGMAVTSLLPLLFELITRKRLSNAVFLVVNIYILFAGVIGSALNVYYLISWYDVLIHCIMGYLIAMLGLFFLCKLKDQSKMKAITVALFCLFFSLGIELIWEIFERILDVFFNQTAQGPKIDGTNAPLVTDTIQDLICNFSGALLFFVHYIVDRYTKVNFGFKYILDDFNDVKKESKVKTAEKEENISDENISQEEISHGERPEEDIQADKEKQNEKK